MKNLYSPRSDTHGQLDIRQRTIAHGDDAETRCTVFCPRQQSSVTVEECSGCSQCRAIVMDGGERGPFLVCAAERSDGQDRASTLGLSLLLRDAKVREVMRGDVACAQATMTVAALADLLLERSISGVPVVDDRGAPIGVVSKTDVLRTLRAGEVLRSLRADEPTARIDDPVTVQEIMGRVPFTVHEQAPLAQAAALMAFEGVHRVPVLSLDGQVVGILSTFDIARWVAVQGGYVLR